jgi:hypothetical protein
MSRHLEFPRHLSWDQDYWLCRCEGFRVEAPNGRLGSVEAVRFGASIGPTSSSSKAASSATACLLFPSRMSKRSYRDSNVSSSAAHERKAATTSVRACGLTWAATHGREAAQGADSAPITVPARAQSVTGRGRNGRNGHC